MGETVCVMPPLMLSSFSFTHKWADCWHITVQSYRNNVHERFFNGFEISCVDEDYLFDKKYSNNIILILWNITII